MRYRESVTTRDMGAFTEAAPSSVRVGELDTFLHCIGSSGETLALQLWGAGEGVLLSHYAVELHMAPLPMHVPSVTWESRAISEGKMPELRQPGILFRR